VTASRYQKAAIIHWVDVDAIRRMESDRAENHEVSGKNLVELVVN